jgi:hypothetical protein
VLRKLWLLLACLLVAVPAAAQITPTYTFVNGTVIDADEVNTNFALLGSALNRTGGTMTGTLTARQITPATTDTYDLGVTGTRFKNLWLSGNADIDGTIDVADDATFAGDVSVTGTLTLSSAVSGLAIPDSDSSQALSFETSSNLTADRTLTLVPGDSDRTITLSGNPTLNDWFDQSVKSDASPSFSAVTLSGSSVSGPLLNATGSTTGNYGMVVIPTVTPSTSTAYGLNLIPTLNPIAGSLAAAQIIQGTVKEANTGTHSVFADLYLQPLTVTSGSATVTRTANLYIPGVASATVTDANYAIYAAGGTIAAVDGFREHSRAFNMGATQAVAYASGNFSVSSGTWTVESGDQDVFSYRVVGDTAFVTIGLSSTSYSGSGNELVVDLPVTPAESVNLPCMVRSAGVVQLAWCIVNSGTAQVGIFLANPSNAIPASTNGLGVYAQLSFKVS